MTSEPCATSSSAAMRGAALSCSAMTRMVMSTSDASFPRTREPSVFGRASLHPRLRGDDLCRSISLASRNHLRFIAQLRHQLLRIGDLATTFALRRLDYLQ